MTEVDGINWIFTAQTLEELCRALNQFEFEHGPLEDFIALSDLPTFGGDEPDEHYDAYSWDAVNLMVERETPYDPPWIIIGREEAGE